MFGLGIVELVLGFALVIVVASVGVRLVISLGRIGSGAPRQDDRALMLEERTARLEENVVTLTEQVERVVTEQEFTNKLLSERAGPRKDQ